MPEEKLLDRLAFRLGHVLETDRVTFVHIDRLSPCLGVSADHRMTGLLVHIS